MLDLGHLIGILRGIILRLFCSWDTLYQELIAKVSIIGDSIATQHSGQI